MKEEEKILNAVDPNFSFTGETRVLLGNKKLRRLDRIKPDTFVLSIDVNSLKFIPVKVTDSDALKEIKVHPSFDKWTFSDNSFLKTVGKVKVFSIEKQGFDFLENCEIGEHILKADGSEVRLIEHKCYKRCVHYFSLELSTNNFIANGFIVGLNEAQNFDYKNLNFLK